MNWNVFSLVADHKQRRLLRLLSREVTSRRRFWKACIILACGSNLKICLHLAANHEMGWSYAMGCFRCDDVANAAGQVVLRTRRIRILKVSARVPRLTRHARHHAQDHPETGNMPRKPWSRAPGPVDHSRVSTPPRRDTDEAHRLEGGEISPLLRPGPRTAPSSICRPMYEEYDASASSIGRQPGVGLRAANRRRASGSPGFIRPRRFHV